jgi:hypothetical protein
MKYWIFTDVARDEFSTTKFASVVGTISSAFVVFKACTTGVDSGLLGQLLIYLGSLVAGTAVIRRFVKGTS